MTDFTRTSRAQWEGDLTKGKGRISLGSGAFSGAYSFNSRFGDEKATNPEELIAAAHAGCFTMALSAGLTKAGHPPQSIETSAAVMIRKENDGFVIPSIHLTIAATVPGLSPQEFEPLVSEAAKNCPVSKALASIEITHTAVLHEASLA